MACCDLGLSSQGFYELTPRQLSLLMDAHRKRLAHSEMCHANTTAAVINFSFSPPESPVDPTIFAPNLEVVRGEAERPAGKAFSEDEILDWQIRIANIAAEMKAGGGPMLDQIVRHHG